eukprot:1386468-Lingulodinium_polyedra.AAC.1
MLLTPSPQDSALRLAAQTRLKASAGGAVRFSGAGPPTYLAAAAECALESWWFCKLESCTRSTLTAP